MTAPAVPAGHGISPHAIFGWCAACTGRGQVDELAEWRAWAMSQFHDPIGPQLRELPRGGDGHRPLVA